MQCFRPGRKGSPEDRAVVRCPAAGPSEHFQGLLPAQPPAPLPPKPSPTPDTHSPVASPQKHLSFPLSRDALISWPLEMTFGFKAGRMRPKQGGVAMGKRRPHEPEGGRQLHAQGETWPPFLHTSRHPSFSGYNAVNEAGTPGWGGAFRLCADHDEGLSMGHGPHSMGLHMARETLLGKRQGVSGTFSENS